MNYIIFRSMVVTSLRDKISLFYALIFPLALLAGLGYYFDNYEMRMNLLGGVTAISTLFWGMQGIAFQVHLQRGKGVYKLLKLTPMPISMFVSFLIAARAAIGLVLHLIVWLTGVVMFGGELSLSSFSTVFLLLAAGVICFTSIGFIIANIARNEGQINMYSNLLQLPMIFMSGTFYSLENAPAWIRMTGSILPFDSFAEALRNTSAGATASQDLMMTFLILFAYAVAAVGLAVPSFRWEANGKESMLGKKKKLPADIR